MRIIIIQLFWLLFLVSTGAISGQTNETLFKKYLSMSESYKNNIDNKVLLNYFSKDAVINYPDKSKIEELKRNHPEEYKVISKSKYITGHYPYIAVASNQLVKLIEHKEEYGHSISCLAMHGLNKDGRDAVLALQYKYEESEWKILKVFESIVKNEFKEYLNAPCSVFDQ